VTDLRSGFTGLSALVQISWSRVRYPVMFLCSVGDEGI